MALRAHHGVAIRLFVNMIRIASSAIPYLLAMTDCGGIYVNFYTRSDGTKVSGYYRSKPKY